MEKIYISQAEAGIYLTPNGSTVKVYADKSKAFGFNLNSGSFIYNPDFLIMVKEKNFTHGKKL